MTQIAARILIFTAPFVAIFGCESEEAASPALSEAPETKIERVALKRVRLSDPDAGRELFVSKGCVICHSVNGVGGSAAPSLDTAIGGPALDPLEFAARMWRGAPAMIDMQVASLGYSLDLTAEEMADLAAFAADRSAQAALDEEDVPIEMSSNFLDRPFWEMDDWMDFMRARRDGLPPAEDGVEFPVEIEELPVDPD